VEAHELERIRRSIIMVPPGHSAGALTRETAMDLIEECLRLRDRNLAYEHVLADLRRLLESVKSGQTER
jgi:hypothetical protein